jgi:DNA-binding NtrC family response regulator
MDQAKGLAKFPLKMSESDNNHLDELARLRRRLVVAQQQIEQLRNAEGETRQQQQQLESENRKLKAENAELSRGLPVETAVLSEENTESLNPVSLTFLGRDKSIFGLVRKRFPHAAQFVGPSSTGFKRRSPPEVLVCRLEKNHSGGRQLVKLIKDRRTKTAFLFYGPGARDFLRNNRKQLLGVIAEVLYEDISEEALLQRLNAIVELRKAICSVEDTNNPLIGRSQKFIDVVTQILRIARFPDPILIRSDDPGEALSAAQDIHRRSGRRGKNILLRSRSLETGNAADGLTENDEHTIQRLFERARNGVVVIDNIGLLSDRQLDGLLELYDEAEQVRLIAIYRPTPENCLQVFPSALESLILDIPSIARRDEDVPLFVHYFTLLHNLQVEKEVYLNQAELNELVGMSIDSIARLRSLVFEKLGAKFATDAAPSFTWERRIKTLEEYLAEFEASILTNTLEQCDGNKSKAARLLGLKPNTLHYKLSRLGIATGKKKKAKPVAGDTG